MKEEMSFLSHYELTQKDSINNDFDLIRNLVSLACYK